MNPSENVYKFTQQGFGQKRKEEESRVKEKRTSLLGSFKS